MLKPFRDAVRRIVSERGSVYMEYCLLTAMVFLAAMTVFAPGSAAFRALGFDFEFREFLIRLPVF